MVYTAMNMRLNRTSSIYICSIISRHIVGDHELDVIVGKLGDINITLRAIRTFADGIAVSSGAINLVLMLLSLRNSHISTNYGSVNAGNVEPYRHSVFFPARFIELLCLDENRLDLDGFLEGKTWVSLHRMYCLLRNENAEWSLLFVDFSLHRMYLIDPMVAQPPPASYAVRCQFFVNLLTPLLLRVLPAMAPAQPWICGQYDHSYYQALTTASDTAVYILCLLYLLVLDCPLVLANNDIAHLRANFAYWIMKGALPV